MKLRPYQEEAIESILRGWLTYKSVLLVLPTGAGKTVIFASIIERIQDNGRVLVLAHREELIEQARKKLYDIGIVAEVEKADLYASTAHLFPVTIASVQTLKGHRLERWRPDTFKTIIVDEAHHAPAVGYRRILDHFSEAKVLGVTATPDRADEIGMHNVFEHTAYQKTILELIEDKYLCDVLAKKLVVEDFDISAVRSKLGKYGDLNEKEVERALGTEKQLHRIAGPLMKERGDRPTLVFMPGVDSSRALADVLRAYMDYPEEVQHIDGKTHPLYRRMTLDQFQRGEVKILVNCAVLTEGFDAPRASCIAICRPTKSRALYTQMVGRGTRVAEGKENLLLLDFVPDRNGAHQLIGPEDALGGKSISPLTKEKLRERLGGGEALSQAVRNAIAEAEAEELRIRFEIDQKARQQEMVDGRSRTLTVDAAYRAVENLRLMKVRKQAERMIPQGDWNLEPTESQRVFLERAGIPVPVRRIDASVSVGDLVDRRKRGLCTYKQAKLLSKNGLRDNVTFQEASSIIDQLAKNKWRPTPELKESYGVSRA